MDNRDLKWEFLYKGSTKGIKSTTSIKRIIDILLENRGIKTDGQKEEFFSPVSPDKLSLKELKIKKESVDRAVLRIKKAIEKKEKIIVYGDYDADGICATAIVWEVLYALGAIVFPYIPDRFSEGYGINTQTVEKLSENNPDLGLIITVDNGIVADKAVDAANKLGIDVIITDHHLKGKRIPKAYSILHTTKIGGAGLAWMMVREMTQKLKNGKTEELKNKLELAAIGTIADQLSLIGPNRSFAKYGLEALNKTQRPGLLALFAEAAIKPDSIGVYEVNFVIAPRINAMGRMMHAIDSLRLLCTTSHKRAKELAQILGKTNKERQKVLEEVVLHAKEVAVQKDWEGVILISHESYHEGIIGLAASKLVEEFHRPSIVVAKGEKYSKASARSIHGFNIIESIRKLEDLIIGGGGHPMAAGFTIETQKLEIFSKKLNEVSTPLLSNEVLKKKLVIDLEIEFNQINEQLVETLLNFEPSGIGNSKPTFATNDINILNARTVGDGKHLSLKLEKNGKVFPAIGFGFGSHYSELSSDKKISLAYNIEKDVWNGRTNIRLKIKDLKINSHY